MAGAQKPPLISTPKGLLACLGEGHFSFNREAKKTPKKRLCVCLQIFVHILFSVSEDNMPSSSQVSYTALSAVGGHCNKPNDPSAAGTDDRPDVGLRNCI